MDQADGERSFDAEHLDADERSGEQDFDAAEQSEQSEDAVLDSPAPEAIAGTLLYLSWLRSVGVLMRALGERFPSPEEWEQVMSDAELHEEIEAFDAVVNDVRAAATLGAVVDLDSLESAGMAHYQRALDSLELTAERFGVPVDDLLVALVHR